MTTPSPGIEPATPSPSTDGPCTVDDGTGEELRALLTDDVPPVYEVAPDGAEDTGPFGLERIVDDEVHLDGGSLLRSLRFRRGISRVWYHPEGADLDVRLYEFCEPEGADGYLRHDRERLTGPMWGFREVSSEEAPSDGTLLIQGEPGSAAYAVAISTHGPYVVVAGARDSGTESEAELVRRATSLLEAQRTALD